MHTEGSVHHKLVDATKVCVRHHLWYLTDEVVVFGLFNDQLSNDERWLKPF